LRRRNRADAARYAKFAVLREAAVHIAAINEWLDPSLITLLW
jgi:hypothetical protein